MTKPHSLIDPEPLPPPNPWPKRIILTVVVLAVAGPLLYWQFRYYRQERLVTRFMDALQAGDYRQAYQVWNPAAGYSFEMFLQDWGETTAFGRVRSYEIVEIGEASGMLLQFPGGEGGGRRTIRVGAGNSSGVIARVRVNGLDPPLRIWVETDPPRLSFPPF